MVMMLMMMMATIFGRGSAMTIWKWQVQSQCQCKCKVSAKVSAGVSELKVGAFKVHLLQLESGRREARHAATLAGVSRNAKDWMVVLCSAAASPFSVMGSSSRGHAQGWCEHGWEGTTLWRRSCPPSAGVHDPVAPVVHPMARGPAPPRARGWRPRPVYCQLLV